MLIFTRLQQGVCRLRPLFLIYINITISDQLKSIKYKIGKDINQSSLINSIKGLIY